MKAESYAALDDERLLGMVAQAHEPALGELYDRYHRLVFSMAYNVIGDYSEAEEITQDVYLRIWRRAGSFDPSRGKVISWITGITRNRTIDVMRRNRVRPEGYLASWTDGHDTSNEQHQVGLETQIEQVLKRERVQKVIESLPEEQRLSLALAFFYGYTHSEIAEIMKTPLGTVKTRIRLAMQKLRHHREVDVHFEHSVLKG